MADRPPAPTDAHFDDAVPAPPPDDAEGPAADAAPADGAPADGADGPGAPADAGGLRAEVDALQAKLLRQAAEYQNYRRRSEGDRAEAVRAGRRDVLLPLLDVYDDLRRSLDAARTAAGAPSGEGGAAGALLEGVELVTQKFQDALARVGVEPIEAVGRPFSEDEHEALMQQPSDDAASGTVLAEVQPGYRLGGRVLRHARVVVAE